MARTTVKKNTYNIKFPGQKGNLLRIMKSDFKPPIIKVNGTKVSPYLWEDEDGYLYVYNCGRWQYINHYVKGLKCDCNYSNSCVSYSDFNQLKEEILNYLDNIGATIELPEDLEERLKALERKEDRDTIYDDTYIRNLINELMEEHDLFLTVDYE